jgi:NTE family protein
VRAGPGAISGLAAGRIPFQVLVGTSAGALNVAYLAGTATAGLAAFDQLGQFWGRLRSRDVYDLRVPGWVR